VIEQAQQLFERDAQIITPEALENVKAAIASSDVEHKAETKKKAVPRKAAGQAWEDPILAEWPEGIVSSCFCYCCIFIFFSNSLINTISTYIWW